MSYDASIEFEWGDGLHRFRLRTGELRELQEKIDSGPAFLHARIVAGMWRVDDLSETLRLALIGGGEKPERARALVGRYVLSRPLWESVEPAAKVLEAAVAGVEDEPLKPAGESERSRPSPMGSSASPIITATAA